MSIEAANKSKRRKGIERKEKVKVMLSVLRGRYEMKETKMRFGLVAGRGGGRGLGA